MEIKYSNSLCGKLRPCHPLNKFGRPVPVSHHSSLQMSREWVSSWIDFFSSNCLISLNFFIAWIANGSHDGRQWWWPWWLTIILIMMMVMMVQMVIIKPTVNDLQAERGGHISCKIRVCDNFVWVPEMSVSVWWSLVSRIKSRNTEECNKSLEKATVDLPGTLHV